MPKQPKLNPYQKAHFTVNVYEETTVVTDMTGQAPRHFVVDENELARLFNLPQQIVLRPEPGLIEFSAKKNQETYIFDVPRKVKPWSLMLRKDIHKPLEVFDYKLPGFLLKVVLSTQGRVKEVVGISALTYSGKKFRPGARLYEMPLPNFSLDGGMCMGNVKLKIEPNTSIKDAALSAIFDSAFNNHNNLIGKKGLDFPIYLQKHQGQAPISTLRVSEKPGIKA